MTRRVFSVVGRDLRGLFWIGLPGRVCPVSYLRNKFRPRPRGRIIRE